MPKFEVTVEWSGYSRGTAVWEVEAENEADARESFWAGREVNRTVIRDDTEHGDVLEVDLLPDAP